MKDKELATALGAIMAKAHELSNDNYDVFVEYHSHVDMLAIRIYKDGWEEFKDVDISINIYLDDYYADTIIDHLREALHIITDESMLSQERANA